MEWIPISPAVDPATKPRKLTPTEIDFIMAESGLNCPRIRVHLRHIELTPSAIPSLIEKLRQAPLIPTPSDETTSFLNTFTHQSM